MTSPKGAVRRLAGARLVSLLGTGAANVALLISMFEATRSAAWVSATLVATHGVQVFFALFTAGLGDRLDRRRLMVACEVAGSGCYLAMVFTPAPGPLLAVALLSAVVASPFHSASAAAIPNLVGREHLSWANSMVSAGRNLGMTLGPVLGGLAAATLGAGTVFAANAVSFLISALVISTVRGRFSGERAAGEDHRGVHAGLVFLWRNRLLRTLLLAEAVLVLGLGLVQVPRVPLVESFGRGSAALGLLDGAWGAGLLIGSLSGRRLHADREPVTFVIGLAGVAAATAAIGLSPWFAPIVAFNLLIGLADSLDLIAGQGIRQRRTPDAVLGRVIAANSSMCVLAQMVGYGASGLLAPIVGAQGVYLICGAVVAGSAVICLRAIGLARLAAEPAPAPPPAADVAVTHQHRRVTPAGRRRSPPPARAFDSGGGPAPRRTMGQKDMRKESTMAPQESGGVILLDVAAGGGRFDRSMLERLGHPVTVCNGPEGRLCPLLGGEGCDKFERAHGIVFELDLDTAQHRAVIRRYRDLAPDLPIRVVVTPAQAERYADLLGEVEVWGHDPTVADLDGFACEVEAADRFAEP